MHPELEQLLNDVIKDIPGSYLIFKKKIIELKNGFNFCQYIEYMSQHDLTNCAPEALLDLGFFITDNTYLFNIPLSLKDISKEPPIHINFITIFNQLKIAAITNLGAQGALFQILNMDDSRFLENAGLEAEQEFQSILKLFEDKKNCPADQKKFSHINEAIIFASDLTDNKDMIAALTQFEASAEKGLALAHNACGLLYENNDEIEEDWLRAVFHYENATKQFHPLGYFNHGWMLQYGRGVKANHSQATQCFLLSAHLGCPEAQYHLARNYEKGCGLPKMDMEKALYWYDQAILQNFSDAIFHKGWLYEKGLGVPQDLLLAAKHYLLAANQNDFKAIARGALKFLLDNPQFDLDKTDHVEISNLLATTPLNDINNVSDKLEVAKWLMESDYINHAIELYGKIIKQYPKNADVYLARAKAYIKTNQNPGWAITDLEQNIKLDPTSASALKALIKIYDSEGLYNEVVIYCTKLLAINSEKYSDYYHFRGVAYADLKKYKLAIEDYTLFIKKYPDNEDVYIARAAAYVELKEYKLAIKDYTVYINKCPDDADGYIARAEAYKNIHWHKAARSDLNHAKRIENSKTLKPKKLTPPLAATPPKLLTNDKVEIPKNLVLFSQNLFIIEPEQQGKSCLILRLIPINDVADNLVKHIHNNHSQSSFRICDLSKLQEVAVSTTKTLLQRFYENVSVNNNTIEITVTGKGHKIINGKPIHELNQLKRKIIEALPEYHLHQKILILKDKYFQLMKSISNLENKLDIILRTVNSNYEKKQKSIQAIIAYDGSLLSIQKIILQLQQIINKIELFIKDVSAQLSSHTPVEFDRMFHSFEVQTGREFIQSLEKLLHQMENQRSLLYKLCHPNYKNLTRTLLELISQFNTIQANERKEAETKTSNEVISDDEKKEEAAEMKTFDVSISKDDELNDDSDDELKEQEMLKLLPPGLLKESDDDNYASSFFRSNQVLFVPNNSSRSEATALRPPGNNDFKNNEVESSALSYRDANTTPSIHKPCKS